MAERRREFNVTQLKNLAAAAVNRTADHVSRFEKLAEGGSNRTFLVSMQDGFQVVARIPYPPTEPKPLLIASEVAIMDFLRSNNIPIPKLFGYSTSSQNPAGTEYIFMEYVQGTNLGDIWYDLGEKARITVVKKLVELESRLFSLRFPASGSLYYMRDLETTLDRVHFPSISTSEDSQFCIGPDTTLSLWYGKRLTLDAFRGPYKSTTEVLTAGAQKELMYLDKHGHALYPFNRLHRELCNYQWQYPSEYVDHLKTYLQPNNVFLSDDLDITGVIDWQHAVILPAFLHGGVPGSLQNYGDDVSESLELPKLPENFDSLSEEKQLREVELFRKRQLHYCYVTETMEYGSVHSDVLMDPFYVLLRKLYKHSSDPCEGDNVTLKANLIELKNMWSSLDWSGNGASATSCPIEFSDNEVSDCLRRATAMREADEQLQTCLDLVRVGPEGWTPVERYDQAKSCAQQLLHDTLDEAESDEERQQIEANWIFDDFDETEYM